MSIGLDCLDSSSEFCGVMVPVYHGYEMVVDILGIV